MHVAALYLPHTISDEQATATTVHPSSTAKNTPNLHTCLVGLLALLKPLVVKPLVYIAVRPYPSTTGSSETELCISFTPTRSAAASIQGKFGWAHLQVFENLLAADVVHPSVLVVPACIPAWVWWSYCSRIPTVHRDMEREREREGDQNEMNFVVSVA